MSLINRFKSQAYVPLLTAEPGRTGRNLYRNTDSIRSAILILIALLPAVIPHSTLRTGLWIAFVSGLLLGWLLYCRFRQPTGAPSGEQERHDSLAPEDRDLLYRRLFDGNLTMQWLVDPQTAEIIDANPAACRFYGYSIEILRTMKVTDINTASAEEIAATLKDGRRDGGVLSFRHNVAGGEVRDVEVRPTYVDINGRTLIHSIIIDVTDRRRAAERLEIAEAKYRNIVENAAEGIYQTSDSGRYLSANPALAAIYGFSSTAELRDTFCDIGRQLYVDPDRRAELREMVERNGCITGAESQVYRKDGSVIWIMENMREVRDHDGLLLHYEGMVQDITSRRELEVEREVRLKEAIDRIDMDPLTGLVNHRAFHKKLHERADEAISSGGTLAVVVMDIANFKFFNDVYGHLAGDDVLKLVASTISNCCRPQDVLSRFGGDEFGLLLPDVEGAELTARIDRIVSTIADMGYVPPGYDVPIPMALSSGAAVFPNDATDRMSALDIANARMGRSKDGVATEEGLDVLRRTMADTVSGYSMLDALVTAVDNKDRYTLRHSEDVHHYCVEIAEQLGLSANAIRDLKVAALLHDVGKIGVPDYILRKPGRLTADEFEAVKQHPIMGAVIVAAVPGLESTLDAVRHHHERWDGGGYPSDLRGTDIPLAARIMAVADAFSAMTTDRPYRKGMSESTAAKILFEGSGVQWDPDCVRAFLQARHSKVGENVKLAARPHSAVDKMACATVLSSAYEDRAA